MNTKHATLFLFLTAMLCDRHIVHILTKPSQKSVHLLASPNATAETQLDLQRHQVNSVKKEVLSELSNQLDASALHDVNTPVYEPFRLTEKQKAILLSHD